MDHKASGAFVASLPPVQVLTAGGAAANRSTTATGRSRPPPKKKPTKKKLSKSGTSSSPPSSSSPSPATTTATSSPRAEITPQKSSSIPIDDFIELEDVVSDHELEDLTPAHDRNNNRGLDRDDAASGDACMNTFHTAADTSGPTKPPPSSSADAMSWIDNPSYKSRSDIIWLTACFVGIMASFVCYGLVLEYTTSGGRQLHELSFLFVTSGLYTLTAAAGRHVRDETPSTIPPARFALLALTSMGSTFTSVRSLRYVIYPIQVLAKSCKPVPVMLMGTLLGKRYPFGKYVNVLLIVFGVAMFMGGGSSSSKHKQQDSSVDDAASQVIGILLLFVSLCFDGGTGAYEDKLMSVHSVGPFDLMYNIQLGKTILAGVGLLVLNQVHVFLEMCQQMGFLLVALGLSGALGQVFIFVTISKFGALTCSIIGLARKVATLVASIWYYGHPVNAVQFVGLVISITSMVMNFWTKKKGGGGGEGHHHHQPPPPPKFADTLPEEIEKMLPEGEQRGDIELASK